MAKFLTTSGITFHLENLVKGARERLVLISPYLRVNERLRQMIDDKDRDKIDIRVVYGKNELQPEENNWLKAKASVRSSFCKNLHAKCYLNEAQAVITSMNLYEFSQVNNEEMGIQVSKEEDPELYAGVYEEAMRLIRISDEVRVTVEKVVSTETGGEGKARRAGRGAAPPQAGYCIRCRSPLKADPSHPYCKSCYAAWKENGGSQQEEVYCHLCGASAKSSLAKPACYDCYRAHKSTLAFRDG